MLVPNITDSDDEVYVWGHIKAEASREPESETALTSYLYFTIGAHLTLACHMSFHHGNKLCSSALLSTLLYDLFLNTFSSDPSLRSATVVDLFAAVYRDLAYILYEDFLSIEHVSPPACGQRFCEIFISHRGPDTKRNVSGLLHVWLSREFRVFLDNKIIKAGDYWLEKIDMDIRACKIGIVVFSPGYCDSYFCLHELALLMECKKTVIPIFCDVKPSELRVRDDRRWSPKDLQRYRWAIEEAKRISGITFDTAEGDWPQFLDDASDAVKNLLEVKERD